MEKALLSWSGGKDAAMALADIMKNGEYEIEALLTTLTEGDERVSMHGVRKELLEAQAEALGLPLEIVMIPQQAGNDIYEQRMGDMLQRYIQRGVRTVIFGDLFLADIRAYREKQLAKVGMNAHFPLWGQSTIELARRFLEERYQAVTVCIDSVALPKSFIGQPLDHNFFASLPSGVDPCGENGEYHTYVFDMPLFRNPLHIEKGQVTYKFNRFYYCDYMKKENSS
ncbi:MAG: diphthine--ammonia ligase [Tuberibacillus sp.]